MARAEGEDDLLISVSEPGTDSAFDVDEFAPGTAPDDELAVFDASVAKIARVRSAAKAEARRQGAAHLFREFLGRRRLIVGRRYPEKRFAIKRFRRFGDALRRLPRRRSIERIAAADVPRRGGRLRTDPRLVCLAGCALDCVAQIAMANIDLEREAVAGSQAGREVVERVRNFVRKLQERPRDVTPFSTSARHADAGRMREPQVPLALFGVVFARVGNGGESRLFVNGRDGAADRQIVSLPKPVEKNRRRRFATRWFGGRVRSMAGAGPVTIAHAFSEPARNFMIGTFDDPPLFGAFPGFV